MAAVVANRPKHSAAIVQDARCNQRIVRLAVRPGVEDSDIVLHVQVVHVALLCEIALSNGRAQPDRLKGRHSLRSRRGRRAL